MSMGGTAIVLAGSRPGGDPFAQEFGTDLKALIPVGGAPMVRRPVAALLESGEVDQVLVLSQQPARIAEVLPADPRLRIEESQGTIAETLLRLCEDESTQWPLLVTTADHALLTAEMVRDFCWRAGQPDVSIGVVSKRRFTERLTESRRTWIPFKGGAYTGANLFVLRSDKVIPAIEVWRSVEQDRKKVRKLLWSLGPWLALLMLLRRLTIDDVLDRIGFKLGISMRAIRLRDPLGAIDVDKMSDHILVESLLAERT